MSDRRWLVRGGIGIAVYVVLTLLPLALMLAPARPEGRTFLREFSVGLAFGGLAILGMQLVLTARFRRVKAPYGIDAVYHFHREISLVALALVLAHPLLLIVDDPHTISLFNVFTAPMRARFAVVALVATGVVICLSYFRRQLRLRYELWRRSHGFLALIALVAAVAHVELVGYYVNTPLKREVWLVYLGAWVATLGWARIVKPALLMREPWRVDSIREERGNSWTLSIVPKRAGLRFDPGQFVWLHLGASPFVMAEHPFSVASSAEARGHLEITIKGLGDFTSTVGSTEVGAIAYVDGPYGQFSVDRRRAKRYAFIAGGVGITPIMSMLRTLADRRDARPLSLVYGANTPEDMTFLEEIQSLTERLDLEFVPVYRVPPDGWQGEIGFIDTGVLGRHLHEIRSTEFFVCGPESMMDAATASLRELGVGASQIRYELFGLV